LNIFGSVEILRKIRKAEKLRIYLDYDGTLADFAKTPDDIHPDQELIDLLKKLNNDPRIQPAVISGRRLSHIRTLIPITGIWLAGTYGIELIDPTGARINRTDYDKVRPVLDKIKPQWQELTQTHPDLYLEDKGWSLALHAKFVDLLTAEKILQQAQNILDTVEIPSENFRILGGHKFLEIAPLLANKSLTIEYLLTRNPLEGALLIYIGDDDKDEEAFKALFKYHGVAIKVCNQPCDTKAQLQINNTNSVRQFLSSLLNSPPL
jgi:trehalose 6-phosphate phosphatase